MNINVSSKQLRHHGGELIRGVCVGEGISQKKNQFFLSISKAKSAYFHDEFEIKNWVLFLIFVFFAFFGFFT